MSNLTSRSAIDSLVRVDNMISWKLLCTGILALSLISKTAADTVHIDCKADWPAASTEKCPYEDEMYKPIALRSRVARGYSPDLTTVAVTDADLELWESITNFTFAEVDTTDIPKYIDENSELAVVADTTPQWPNKWTASPCCTISCGCYKFFETIKGHKTKYMSQDFKKARCCWQKMADWNCINPPAFETMQYVQPPWCIR